MSTQPTTSKSSLNILFDEIGQQIQMQQDYGNRLSGKNSLFDTIESAGWNHRIGAISKFDLPDADVLVLTNRVTQGYTRQELTLIVEFVRSGKGLWCMSNHAPFHASDVGSQMNDHIRYDSAVSTTFLTSYQAAAYQGPGPTEIPLEGTNLTCHPIILGNPGWPLAHGKKTSAVGSVVTRSFCGVYQNDFTSTIAGLQGLDNVINYQYTRKIKIRGKEDEIRPPVSIGVVWAVSLEGFDVTGNGRVVIGADAGWLGNTYSTKPGPGEFQNGDNPQYALNTLAWLGRLG